MRFVIERAGSYGIKPSDNSFKVSLYRVDERWASMPEEIIAYGGKSDWWYGEGENHRVENNHIIRDMREEVWVIEIDNLTDLLKLQAAYDKLRITTSHYHDGSRNLYTLIEVG